MIVGLDTSTCITKVGIIRMYIYVNSDCSDSVYREQGAPELFIFGVK